MLANVLPLRLRSAVGWMTILCFVVSALRSNYDRSRSPPQFSGRRRRRSRARPRCLERTRIHGSSPCRAAYDARNQASAAGCIAAKVGGGMAPASAHQVLDSLPTRSASPVLGCCSISPLFCYQTNVVTIDISGHARGFSAASRRINQFILHTEGILQEASSNLYPITSHRRCM